MVAEQMCRESVVVARWSETLDALHARSEGRYLADLLERVERKNGWQLAEAIGECSAKGVQRLLNTAAWDADAVRDDLRDYVVDHLSDAASGILIVDETGFLKKGTKSCGVARQYPGTAGDTVNCHATQRVPGCLPRLCLGSGCRVYRPRPLSPRAWTQDAQRRSEASIPAEVRFASKITLAEQMPVWAFAAAVPAQWVVADSFYGRSGAFRHWLEERSIYRDHRDPSRHVSRRGAGNFQHSCD